MHLSCSADYGEVAHDTREPPRLTDVPYPMTIRTLTPELLQRIDAYWRAANYLSVGQIYLRDNPLLRRPLTLEHVKPRLLGHWGTTPGLNFIYAHLNRVIRARDLNAMFITGPGQAARGSSRRPGSRAATPRSIRTSRATSTAWAASSASSPSLAGSP